MGKQVKRIEEQLVLGYELLNMYKQDSETLRGDIDNVMNNLIEKTEGVLDDVQPDIYSDYKSLKKDIKGQKEENELLYKNLFHLKREAQEQRDKVALCKDRVQKMEQHVGMIADNPIYATDALEAVMENNDASLGGQSLQPAHIRLNNQAA